LLAGGIIAGLTSIGLVAGSSSGGPTRIVTPPPQ
jgi:hypothetical protein